ncbi:MAG: alpha/beta hydrolase [Alphaproteobacteria bacterium]|nr:alpha/beta hydrolase [Alphaproteobacteria bacterium]MCB9930576.1 alpha/beta hydrolase [Alphaproteobacteria bacterium]
MRSDPIERRFQGSAATLAYFEWEGTDGAPTLLLAHATGFHARVWDRLVRELPADWRVLAVDLRGHGRSSKDGPFDRWEYYGQDLVELADHLALEGVLASGHSMGGWAVCYAALERPRAFRRLVLIDPTMNSPEFYGTDRYPGMKGPEDHPASRRRNAWADWQALHDRLKDRKPYSLWQAAVLEDYCRYGVLPAPSGDGFVLACPPLVEASVYMNSWRAYLHPRLKEIEAPVTILRAKRRELPRLGNTDYSGSPTWERLWELFRKAEDIHLPEFTHFLPMQDPKRIAGYIAAAGST